MIRLRIKRGVSSETLLADGYIQCETEKAGVYYKKFIGSYEIQMKPYFPYNLRIQDFDDNRVPWILMKFLLKLEEGDTWDGTVKVLDNGHYKTLGIKDTLSLIEELNKHSDIHKRISKWYLDWKNGLLKF